MMRRLAGELLRRLVPVAFVLAAVGGGLQAVAWIGINQGGMGKDGYIPPRHELAFALSMIGLSALAFSLLTWLTARRAGKTRKELDDLLPWSFVGFFPPGVLFGGIMATLNSADVARMLGIGAIAIVISCICVFAVPPQWFGSGPASYPAGGRVKVQKRTSASRPARRRWAEITGDTPAARILLAAYPAERERERAVRWLAWVARHMGAAPEFAWWDVPAWVGKPAVDLARMLAGALALGLGFGVGFGAFAGPKPGLAGGIVAAAAALFTGSRMKPGKLRRAQPPQAMFPRLPRSGRETAVLALALVTGLFIRRTLIRLWADPVADSPSVTPDGSYRACRRSTAIDAGACVLTGLPVAVVAVLFGQLALLPVAAALAGFALLAALADGTVPALRQAELALLLRCGRRVRFHRQLQDAVARQILEPRGVYYQFRDPDVAEYLTGVQQAAVRAPKRTSAAANPVTRVQRIAADVGCGVGVATMVGLWPWLTRGHVAILGAVILALVIVAFGAAAAIFAMALALGLLTGLARSLRWSQRLIRRMSPAARVAWLAAAACGAGLAVLPTGPAVVRHEIAAAVIAVMPAAMVAGVGGWASALLHSRWQAAWPRVLRYAADALLAAAVGAAILLLAEPGVLGAQVAAGLLFPVAIWLSVIGWRAMNDADQLAVRAAADIAVSLMLGAALVLSLVWLANVLRMPAAEVAVLRDSLSRAGAVIYLPWWLWTGLYLLLAGASLMFACWPGRLTAVTRWFIRLRIVPSVTVSRRVLTGMHIGLLVIVLIGLTAPAAAGPALRARLADRYTETLTDTLRAHGELVAYQEIQREFSPGGPVLLAPLADVILEIDHISRPSAGTHDATGVELDLARRIGELQAAVLAPRPPQVAQAEAAATRQAGFDTPAASPDDEGKRLTDLDSAEEERAATRRLADQAAELAAGAIASALQLPGLGYSEVVEVIQEYLSSLIEDSPLKDVFAGWAGRLIGRNAPPEVTKIVVPDPRRLRDAAAAAATAEMARTPVDDPTVIQQFLGETAAVAAVDLTNQTRYLQEGSGPCDGCAQPEAPGDQPGQGPEDHPVEPDPGF